MELDINRQIVRLKINKILHCKKVFPNIWMTQHTASKELLKIDSELILIINRNTD